MKESVHLVLLNDNGEILSVSRKNNHNDFGLIGGKVDETDNSRFDALIRETKEETGLTIYEKDLTLVFAMHKNGYMGYTYLCKYWEGNIETNEPHIVKWTNFTTILNGSFGDYNIQLMSSLIDMGIKL